MSAPSLTHSLTHSPTHSLTHSPTHKKYAVSTYQLTRCRIFCTHKTANTAICSVKINTTLPENQDPKPSLEDDEFIETFTTPLITLYAECKKLEAEGYAIDARVGTFAQGIELSKRMNL